MLFNSHIFIFAFLPLAVCGHAALSRWAAPRAAKVWLVAASWFFYGWWDPRYLVLILASIGVNFAAGIVLARRPRLPVLVVALTLNLGALAWFKYAGFVVENLNRLGISDYHLKTIILPLAISFYTFQQIAYLVDVYRGAKPERDLLNFALFVSFFPQLIAGPIVRYREMAPQFWDMGKHAVSSRFLAAGLTLFLIGLFKKVVLADGVAVYASPVFEAADQGASISFFEGWGSALAYTYQIYFDFSGYSDMALGLANMFGLRLPLNFNSPYQAGSIIEFWRRWHITLSRFLKEHVYIPLGGNRKGRTRLYLNLVITTTLGGIWHGAGWNFMIWGALHGLFLVINVMWRKWPKPRTGGVSAGKIEWLAGWLLTFVLVVLARVFFRTVSIDGAIGILKGTLGFNGAVLDERLTGLLGWLDPLVAFEGRHAGYFDLHGVPWLIALSLVCWFMPNPVRILGRFGPALEPDRTEYGVPTTDRILWRPNRRWAVAVIVIGFLAITHLARVTEFIYYQF